MHFYEATALRTSAARATPKRSPTRMRTSPCGRSRRVAVRAMIASGEITDMKTVAGLAAPARPLTRNAAPALPQRRQRPARSVDRGARRPWRQREEQHFVDGRT